MLDEEKKLDDVVDNNEDKEENEEEISAETEQDIEAIESGIVPELRDADIVPEVKSAFLDYSMSVIVSRAIPDVRDGLKPVHRRIIYSMYESGTTPDKPFKKCARIVGDVMGKYHPHGDAAIYSTLVRLAQPFSMRYTLADGHGNFGSIDGDEAAAYRYTEARMAKLALEMVKNIDDNTVDFVDNYDGTEREPAVLPSRFPNLLVNGSSGIAVGMATNMIPHNLTETISAVKAIAANPDITPEELLANHILGPDFPTGGIVLGKTGILDYYKTGTGSITIKSKCDIENNEKTGKSRIIVSEIPYQVNKSKMIEQMAQLVKDKIIEGITDIRDESNKEGIRVVIDLRRDVIPEVILNNLLKLTQLQTSIGVINLCLVDGVPHVLSMPQLLQGYLDFQIEVIDRRTKFLLKRDADRKHIVEGLILTSINIDEVVEIIRRNKTVEEAAAELCEKFGFDEPQVQAVLSMTLRRLVGLELQKLQDEKAALEANITEYNRIISSRENEIEVVLSELDEIDRKFGDERRTEISNSTGSIDDESLIPNEDIVITLTANGYIKRLTSDTFKTQHRGGKGVKGMNTHEEDSVITMLHTVTHTDILFFTNFGKVYRIRGYQIPEYARVGKGLPVQNLLDLDPEEKAMALIPCFEYQDDHYLFFVTEKGIVKRTPIKEFESIRQNGKIAITLREGDSLLDVKHTTGHSIIGLASSEGKMVKFHEEDVRSMGRTAAGVKGMNVGNQHVVSVTVDYEGQYILVLSSKGYGKMSPAEDYRLTSRGTKGVKTINATDKVGQLVAMRAVKGDEDLLVITISGIVIRTPISQIKICGRNTQGVRIIRIDEKSKVSSIAIVDHEEDEPETPVEGENSEATANDENVVDNGENSAKGE